MNTKLTKERLEDSRSLFLKLAEACESCHAGDTWSNACRSRGLDPRKARLLVLEKLDGITETKRIPLEEQETVEEYDGYEQFYQKVFGKPALVREELPYDYRESVRYVLHHTGLKPKDIEVLTKRYGIGDTEEKKTMDALGKELGVTRAYICDIEQNAIRLCRNYPRLTILKSGLAKYQKAKALEKQMADEALDHLKETFNPPEVASYFEVSLWYLDLSTRSQNALNYAGLYTIRDLLEFLKTNELTDLADLGKTSAREIRKKLDAYLGKAYRGLGIREAQLALEEQTS